MRWVKSWLQSANVWKHLAVRFLFFFVFLNLSDPLVDLLLPPHHVRWQIGHILSLSILVSVITECFQSMRPQPKPSNGTESNHENIDLTGEVTRSDPR